MTLTSTFSSTSRSRVLTRCLKALSIFGCIGMLCYATWAWSRTRDVLPVFVDPPPGVRAPSFDLAGASVGSTTLPALRKRLAGLLIECRDTSMRGLMRSARAEGRRALFSDSDSKKSAAVEKYGVALAFYYSKKEQNPQTQLACDDVPLHALDQRYSEGEKGEVMFVFDDAAHTLRHVSISRTFSSQKAALTAHDAALTRFEVFGEAREQLGARGTDAKEKIFARHRPITTTWPFANRRAVVSVLNAGPAQGIHLREVFEVPLPLRVTSAAGST